MITVRKPLPNYLEFITNNMLNENLITDKFTIDELLRRGWKYRKSGEFVTFFNFIARFSHYSRFNTMLVYIQNPAVTFFGGTSYWRKKFNRTVKDEARPYLILAPKGPVMLVYDLFDTTGAQTPEQFLQQGLGAQPNEVIGKLDSGLLSKVLEAVRAWGIKLTFKPLSYFNAGYVTTAAKGHLEICLKEGMSNEENFAVLIHELAHLFLGHTGHNELKHITREKPIRIESRKLSQSAEELEAEAISFLICKKLGLETRSAEYIAGYIKSEDDLIQFSYEQVIKTADKIESTFI